MTVLRRAAGLAGVGALVAATSVGVLSVLSRRIERDVPPQGRFIDIDGNAIHYIDQGSGPVVVLVHGLGGQTRNFTYAVADLLATKYRVLTLDRPGSGYSTRVSDSDADLRSQADILTRFLDALAIERPLLVGHSLGGALVLAAALDNPGRFAGLALVTPLVFPQTAPPAALRLLAIPFSWARLLVAWSVALPLSALRREQTLSELFGPEPVPADFATKGGGLLGVRPSMFYATSTDLAALPDVLPGLAARYPDLDLPVGVLVASGDRILDPAAHGEKLASVAKNVTVRQVPGGHMLPLTQPQLVADWIAEQADRARAA